MNNLHISNADEDGFIITDKEQDKIYIYDSEIDDLIQMLKKRKYEVNNIRGQHSSHSKEQPSNAKQLFKDSYADYMQSDEWKKRRILRLQYDAHRCVNCGGTVGLEVHHISYDNFGHEDVKLDLRTLCGKCHGKKSCKDKKRRYVITECS